MENKKIDLKYITNSRSVFFDIAKNHIKKDSIVLDIGAGEGAFAKHCERKDFYLYDGNPESITTLKEEYENCFLGTLPILPFEKNTFDLIHCSHVVEHLEPQIFYDTLKEMDRCLKSNGYLVISAPLMWAQFYDDLSHLKPYNPSLYLKYLTKNTNKNYTRDKISASYKLIELQYRYTEICYTELFTNIKSNIFAKIICKLINLIYRLGIRRYQKNGYTIVLKKQNE